MKQILIVEDDPDIAALERDYLLLNGMNAAIESNGTRALEKLINSHYDALVVDLMIPGCSGFDIIKQIRTRLEIPVIVVSARTEDIDKIRGFELGADDYLVKPFSPSELVARIKSHLSRYERLSGTIRQDTICAGNIEIRQQSHQVFVNGKEVDFTSTEYELLVFLASHQSQVFTKEQLFSAVWGTGCAGDLATIAVHIQKLRKKIEQDPSNPVMIETLWGTGYRFN